MRGEVKYTPLETSAGPPYLSYLAEADGRAPGWPAGRAGQNPVRMKIIRKRSL